MDQRTLRALQGSIEKWERNLELAEENNLSALDLSRGSCPLCDLFWRYDSGISCRGCPIFERTGFLRCQHTPYYRVGETQYENLQVACTAAIEDEITLLRSLLPPEIENVRQGRNQKG
jgi:hypothetical protein